MEPLSSVHVLSAPIRMPCTVLFILPTAENLTVAFVPRTRLFWFSVIGVAIGGISIFPGFVGLIVVFHSDYFWFIVIDVVIGIFLAYAVYIFLNGKPVLVLAD